MDIFHILASKEEDGIEAGRIYVRALFTAEEISEVPLSAAGLA